MGGCSPGPNLRESAAQEIDRVLERGRGTLAVSRQITLSTELVLGHLERAHVYVAFEKRRLAETRPRRAYGAYQPRGVVETFARSRRTS